MLEVVKLLAFGHVHLCEIQQKDFCTASYGMEALTHRPPKLPLTSEDQISASIDPDNSPE